MADTIAQLLDRLTEDTWRSTVGFSPEIEAANRQLFDASASEDQLIATASEWIQRHQPCLFGRTAAKSGFLSFCILTETDLGKSDESIRDKIQAARSTWTREGFDGRKSGFIILAVSQRLANAAPDENVRALALRLCSLYLLQDVVPDTVFLDEIWLEKPGRDRTTWKWHAGVNYFASHGDRRWWHDHRFPGGMAFSINSVGHMVKSGILAKAMIELEHVLGAPAEGWNASKVDSLGTALDWAMRTISMASDAVSGKATRLLPIPRDVDGQPVSRCPVELPEFLAGYDYCNYLGHYHTDYTVPSEYFRPDVERPKDLPEHVLDFTYLFDDSLDNPDHLTMGEGRRVREGDRRTGVGPAAPAKRSVFLEEVVPISSQDRLRQALTGS